MACVARILERAHHQFLVERKLGGKQNMEGLRDGGKSAPHHPRHEDFFRARPNLCAVKMRLCSGQSQQN